MANEPKAKSLRLDQETDTIIQAWQHHLNEDRPGSPMTTSEVIRHLIVQTGMPPKGRRKASG